MKRLFEDEAGSVAVLVSLCFVILIGFTALVVDVGRMYFEYNKLARAVDSAALAGAQELPRNPANVIAMTREYAERNGVNPDLVTISVNGSNKEVAVKGVQKVFFTFAPVIGLYDSDVTAQAKARVGAISSVGGAVPLAVEKQKFVYGERYILKYGAGGNYDQDGDGIPDSADDDDDNDGIPDEDDIDSNLGARTGWFGGLALGGSGASTYEENLKKGYDQVLKVGQIVYTERGNISGPTSDGVQFRMSKCVHTPRCTVTAYNPACPTLGWLPVVVQVSSGNLARQVKIVGFAAFILEGVGGSGVNNYITGHFVQETTSGDFGSSSDGYGLMAVKLVE